MNVNLIFYTKRFLWFYTEAPLSGLLKVNIMALTYENFSSTEVLRKLAYIRYAEAEQMFGVFNTAELNLTFSLNLEQLSLQADIFARTILTHRSEFDLKRFLGKEEQDWYSLLAKAYIYDAARCVYYGFMSYNLLDMPNDLYSFPGHVIMAHMLSKMTWSFENNNPQQPFTFYVNVKRKGNVNEVLKEVFEFYPDIKLGISENENVPSYVNVRFETILKGLKNGQDWLNKRGNDKLYQMNALNDPNISSLLAGDSCPLFNSYLSNNGGFDKGNKFYFILPVTKNGAGVLRNNESVFIGRAIGLLGEDFTVGTYNNNFYNVATRNPGTDPLVRDELYAITGLKTELVPYGLETIKKFVNVVLLSDQNGNSTYMGAPDGNDGNTGGETIPPTPRK